MTNQKYYLTIYYSPTKEIMFKSEISIATYLDINKRICNVIASNGALPVLEFESNCKKHTFFIHRETLQQCVITLSKI